MQEKRILELLRQALREELSRITGGWPRWLPTKEAVRYSVLSAWKLRELARSGEIYAKNIGGGKLIFDRESIDDYMLREKALLKAHLDRLKRSGLC